MANTFLTPDIIAREALMVLRNNAVMAKLVHRDYSADFNGAVGDTITIRKPATFVANDYNGSIEVQDATETSVSVVMDKHLDVSFAVTSKQMTMDIEVITKMSWGFILGDYTFDKDTRTIIHKSVKKIFDVSAVSIPANNNTEINARSWADGVIDLAARSEAELDERRRRLRLKIFLQEDQSNEN